MFADGCLVFKSDIAMTTSSYKTPKIKVHSIYLHIEVNKFCAINILKHTIKTTIRKQPKSTRTTKPTTKKNQIKIFILNVNQT